MWFTFLFPESKEKWGLCLMETVKIQFNCAYTKIVWYKLLQNVLACDGQTRILFYTECFVHSELLSLALIAAAFLVLLTLGAVVDSSPRTGLPGFRVYTACLQSSLL